MPFYFSAEKTAFYNIAIVSQIPSGMVEISDKAYHDLLEGQSNGKRITSDSNGYPILVEHESHSVEYQWDTIKQKRNSLLAETDWTQLLDVSQTVSELYKPYRQALRDITTQSDPFNIIWPIKPA